MASLAAAFKRNAPVTLSELHGRATSLGARRVSDRCLWWKGRHEITPVQVTDEEAAAGCRALVDECRTHTELACGASIAACLYRPELFAPGAAVLVTACGGIGISKK
jgi:L-serine/L-threonine ammonia-lyase